MKHLLKSTFPLILAIIGFMFFATMTTSCKKEKKDPKPTLATTPLYDTLGWFIQGAQGKVAGNGTKMINDPDNPGKKIQAGRLAIRTVVDKAIMIIAADTVLNVYFPTLLSEVTAGNTTGYSHLLETFTDFVQQAVSSQEVYKGLPMTTAHTHATFSRFGDADHPTSDEADFDQFINDVGQAANSLNVPTSVTGQLATLLISVKGDIVH